MSRFISFVLTDSSYELREESENYKMKKKSCPKFFTFKCLHADLRIAQSVGAPV